jgi:hypothetical protein
VDGDQESARTCANVEDATFIYLANQECGDLADLTPKLDTLNSGHSATI